MVTEGRVAKARRLAPASNNGRMIYIQPDGSNDLTVLLPATPDCAAEGAICTQDGGPLSNRLEVVIPGTAEGEATSTEPESLAGPLTATVAATSGPMREAGHSPSRAHRQHLVAVARQALRNRDVVIVLPVTTDCDAQEAICTEDGRMLSKGFELRVPGPDPKR